MIRNKKQFSNFDNGLQDTDQNNVYINESNNAVNTIDTAFAVRVNCFKAAAKHK